jgi:hypothetical protein
MKYLLRATSAAAGNGLSTTINEHSPAMHDERRRGQRPGHYDQVPATHNERRREQRPDATAKYLRCTTSGAAGNGLGTDRVPARRRGHRPEYRDQYLRGAAGIGLDTAIKFLRRSTSGAAGNGLSTTIKYLCGLAGIGLDTTIKYLRRTTSAAANNGLGTTAKYLVNQNAGAGNNWAEAGRLV